MLENLTKICKVCKEEKNISLFAKKYAQCKVCLKIKKILYTKENKDLMLAKDRARNLLRRKNKSFIAKNKERYQNNKEKNLLIKKVYYQNNKDVILQKNKKFRQNNKLKIYNINKTYRNKNKDKLNKNLAHRNATEPMFRLRKLISGAVRYGLKLNNSSKNRKSSKYYLPFSYEELKIHIECLFSHPDNLTSDGKIWMTWKNQGNYRVKDWKDEDSSTWKWQLDHIIPHSTFKYTDMECQEFKDCWSLENLRPYSAKQNIIDNDRQYITGDIMKNKQPLKPSIDTCRIKLNLEDLLFKTYYTNYDGVEIHSSDFRPGNDYQELSPQKPTLVDILALVPKDVPLDKVHIELSIENSESGNIFEGISMFYYDSNKYDELLVTYQSDLTKYNESIK